MMFNLLCGGYEQSPVEIRDRWCVRVMSVQARQHDSGTRRLKKNAHIRAMSDEF
jgi:hypothetical protein